MTIYEWLNKQWTAIPAKDRAAFASFCRVLVGCVVVAFAEIKKMPWELNHQDLLDLVKAVYGAAVVTLVNYFRKGETRFGVGANQGS